MRVAVVGHGSQETNPELVLAWRAAGLEALLLSPEAALAELHPGDIALVRLDVLKTLDGVEPGLRLIGLLEQRGVRVLNPPHALIAAHDKLGTARALRAAGIPHPRTAHVESRRASLELDPPLVLKPRFGSWGRDVFLCEDEADVRRRLREVRQRTWFRRHGALIQEVVPPRHHDLRLVVAGGRVVGAARRVAAEGEWRTNVSLGGRLEPARPTDAESTLAIAAARAIGIDLAGVDLLPVDGGQVVLELNGAVDFDERYSLRGGDVYLDAAAALGLIQSAEMSATSALATRSRSFVRIASD